MAGFRTFESNIGFSRQTVSGSMMLVSGRYFSVVGIQPLMGRLIAPEDDTPGGGNAVAVLDYRYWRDKLGSDAGVLNQIIKVNGQPFTVAGITPPSFTGTTVGAEASVFLPMSFKPRMIQGWDGTDKLSDYWVYLLARLRPGVTLSQAEGALNGPYQGVVEEMASTIQMPAEKLKRFRQQKLTLKNGSRGNSDFREEYSSALRILILATGLVLLIAMANAANLLLVRAAERRKELAIRAAMGASRSELIGQFLTEALVLAFAGGLTSLAIAAATLRLLLVSWGGQTRESFASTGLNWPVLWFNLGLSLASGLFVGLYPAWDAARTSLAATLSDASSKASSSRGSVRLRKALVCAQVTISIVLLIPTGLFLKSLVNLLHVYLGIRTANVIGFRITPQWNGYTAVQSRTLFERAEAELAAIPGVRSAVGSSVPLLGNSNWGTSFNVEGWARDARQPNSKLNEVGPGFFGKSGIPLLTGREFGETDNATAPKVVIVNEAFVQKFFAGHNPIGHRIGFGKAGELDTEIVGIVKDSHYAGVRQQPPPLFYRPWRQDGRIGAISFYVRSELSPKQIIPMSRLRIYALSRSRCMRTFDPTN